MPLPSVVLKSVVVFAFGAVGKLDKTAVLKAICAGYLETTDPPICLSDTIETNECADNNGGCWERGSITACKVDCRLRRLFWTYTVIYLSSRALS